MRSFYTDLHIHLGRGYKNKPVKIAASAQLTLENVIEECVHRRGIDMIGLVDSVCTSVTPILDSALETGLLTETDGGGWMAGGGRLCIIPGAELEIVTPTGAAHFLSYFPTMTRLLQFQTLIKPHVTNLSLSSQVVRVSLNELTAMTDECGGMFVLAHAFTPHKGYFGRCAAHLDDYFDETAQERIAAVEMGLSSDVTMADQLGQLHRYPYTAASDAHSLKTIAREYTVFRLNSGSFDELVLSLQRKQGRGIAAYYGLDPRLGKYYRTLCPRCERQVPLCDDRRCPVCGRATVAGVADRLEEIASPASTAPSRPPYTHQVPLQFIPGLGPATVKRLLHRFGTHMNILHRATYAELTDVVNETIAHRIVAAREGDVAIAAGAGGRYGKVVG